jgi:hypothetical protein
MSVACLMAACGYRIAGGMAPTLPPTVRTIAIPFFENETLAYRIEQILTSAVTREFLTRTNYHVQTRPEGADAVLRGAVTALYSSPIVFDPSINRTTEVLLTVTVRMSLVSSATGEVLYEASDWTYREPYEVSRDPATYLGEDQPAMERLSRRVAASLVSALIEGTQ